MGTVATATGTEGTAMYDRFQLTSKTHIRVLELDRSQSGRLSFNLRVTDLTQKPAFWAVSYAWGQQTETESILVAGESLNVTKSLLSVLYEIEQLWTVSDHGDPVDALWIDQISINQGDLVEKSTQVALMPRIFSHATSVLVYLGSAPDADDAVNLITSMAPHIEKQLAEHQKSDSALRISSDELSEYKALNWTALRTMLTATWFRRAWVVQEVGLAKQAIALYGTRYFMWHTLMNLFAWFDLSDSGIRQYHRLPGWTTHRIWISFDPTNRCHTREFSQYSSLDFLGHTACTYRSTKRRDHLYAFLGHPSLLTSVPENSGYQQLIESNYQSSIREVYVNFARRWLERYRGSHLLSCVNHENLPLQLSNLGADDTERLEFPSWCPRWHHMPLGGTRFNTESGYLGVRFNASASTAFEFQLLTGDKLQVRGFGFDEVAAIFPNEDEMPPTNGKIELVRLSEDSIKTVLKLVYTSWEILQHRENMSAEVSAKMLANVAQAAIGAYWPGAFPGPYSNPLAGFKASVYEARKAYSDQDRLDSPYESALDGLCAELNNVRLEDIEPAGFIGAVQNISANRRFFLTKSGRVGLGPLVSQVGDTCHIISGADVPYVLRPLLDSTFFLVGECHVPGVMRGEAILSTTMTDSLKLWERVILI